MLSKVLDLHMANPISSNKYHTCPTILPGINFEHNELRSQNQREKENEEEMSWK